jgi:hypothetical protein
MDVIGMTTVYRAVLFVSSPERAREGGNWAIAQKKHPVMEITEPNRSRPGVIRTHDQGIMSGDEPEE